MPGVKGLIPNGRNADGSLKNIEFTTNNVLTYTQSYTQDCWFLLNSNSISQMQNTDILYDEEKNEVIYIGDGTNISRVVFANAKETSGVISNFNPKTCFHALDYNDKGTIAGWGMPSDRYIDLTLGASGTQYTAPANGWFTACVTSSTAHYCFIKSHDSRIGSSFQYNTGSGEWHCVTIPCKSGDVVTMQYGNCDFQRFAFVYAEGEIV